MVEKIQFCKQRRAPVLKALRSSGAIPFNYGKTWASSQSVEPQPVHVVSEAEAAPSPIVLTDECRTKSGLAVLQYFSTSTVVI